MPHAGFGFPQYRAALDITSRSHRGVAPWEGRVLVVADRDAPHVFLISSLFPSTCVLEPDSNVRPQLLGCQH